MYAPVTTVIRHLFVFHFSVRNIYKVWYANPQRLCVVASFRAWSSQDANRPHAEPTSHFQHLAGLQRLFLRKLEGMSPRRLRKDTVMHPLGRCSFQEPGTQV